MGHLQASGTREGEYAQTKSSETEIEAKVQIF